MQAHATCGGGCSKTTRMHFQGFSSPQLPWIAIQFGRSNICWTSAATPSHAGAQVNSQRLSCGIAVVGYRRLARASLGRLRDQLSCGKSRSWPLWPSSPLSWGMARLAGSLDERLAGCCQRPCHVGRIQSDGNCEAKSRSRFRQRTATPEERRTQEDESCDCDAQAAEEAPEP